MGGGYRSEVGWGTRQGFVGYTQVLGEGHTQVSSWGGGWGGLICSASSWSLWGLCE